MDKSNSSTISSKLATFDMSVACVCGVDAAALLEVMKNITPNVPTINLLGDQWSRLPASEISQYIPCFSQGKINRLINKLEESGFLTSRIIASKAMDASKYYSFTCLTLPVAVKKNFKKQQLKMGLKTKVFKRDGYTCVCCQSKDNLSVDHIHPESRGGSSDLSNLQTLCLSCNTSKGAKTMQEWLGGDDEQVNCK